MREGREEVGGPNWVPRKQPGMTHLNTNVRPILSALRCVEEEESRCVEGGGGQVWCADQVEKEPQFFITKRSKLRPLS